MHITTFTSQELEKIHEASLKVLAKTGVIFHSTKILEMFRKSSARVENDKVFITPGMVEKALNTAPESFTWQARNKDQTVTIGTGKLAIQPNIGPVYVHDLENGRRKSTFADFINMQKLAQSSDIVNLVGSLPLEPNDLDQNTKHLQMMHAVLKYTDKPIIGLAAHEKTIAQTLGMMELAIQPCTSRSLKEDHWIGVAINPLSPLTYSPDALETILGYAMQNQPIFIGPAIMAGVTGPIHPLGTIILQNAEILAGIVLTQLINPGNPVVYVCASTAAYMKNASFVTGTPEMSLIHAGGIQLGKEYYNFPTRSLCGMSDAKTIDYQAGLESMCGALVSILSKTDMMVESLGCLESFMATSYEKFILDEEIISRALVLKKGINASDADIDTSLDLIMDVGHGQYLTHPSTLKNFRDRWTPSVSNWDIHDTWASDMNRDIIVKANKKVKERLSSLENPLIFGEEDARLKKFMENSI